MKITTYKNTEDFRKDTDTFLSGHEAKNSLILGISGNTGKADWFLASVMDRQEVVLAAVMTPPHNLVLTDGPEHAVRILDDHIKKQGIDIPGLVGPVETTNLFAECTGRKSRVTMEQLIYECREVIYSGDVSGNMRRAEKEDASFLVEWMRGLHREAGLTEPVETVTSSVSKTIEDGRMYIWIDEAPVSAALHTGKTPKGIRIGGVYTPPRFRRRGYATSNVAALTQKMFDEGNEFCFLYTDKSNPISNNIYRKIGYRQITESQMIRFEDIKKRKRNHYE